MLLTIRDRIEVAKAVHEGNKQLDREFRVNRVAGFKKHNKDSKNPVNDNETKTTGKEKKNPFKKKDKNPNHPEKVEEKKPEPEKVEEKKPVKTESDIKAEAEAPVENAGAEKIKHNGKKENRQVVEKTVAPSDNTGAAMSNGANLNQDSGVLDFSAFGVNIDTNLNPVPEPPKMDFQLNGNPEMDTYAQRVFRNPVQQPTQPIQNSQMPVYQQPPIIPQMMAQQPVPQPQPIMSSEMPAPPPAVGRGRHKVDTPIPPKPPKPPKAKPDVVDMRGMPDVLEGVEVEYFPKKDVRTIGVLEDQVPMEAEPPKLTSVFTDANQPLFKDFPYLQYIEEIGLDNGYQVGFSVRPCGLINCFVCDPAGAAQIPGKGFVIDPGRMYDGRAKIFVNLKQFYDGDDAYPLFTTTAGSPKKVLNASLIKDLIVGGNLAVENVKGLYSKNYRGLNKAVALITIPSDKIRKPDRKYIQNRLGKVFESGLITKALSNSPNGRFRIADYSMSDKTILLDTLGVPVGFGGQYCNPPRVQMIIGQDSVTVLTSDFVDKL